MKILKGLTNFSSILLISSSFRLAELTSESTFELFLENNSVGDVVTGTVINLVDFGAFVKLKENVEIKGFLASK